MTSEYAISCEHRADLYTTSKSLQDYRLRTTAGDNDNEVDRANASPSNRLEDVAGLGPMIQEEHIDMALAPTSNADRRAVFR